MVGQVWGDYKAWELGMVKYLQKVKDAMVDLLSFDIM